MGADLKGMDKVQRNLDKELKGMKINSARGLAKIDILIRRDTVKSRPTTPKDTGNLRQSLNSDISERQRGYVLRMEYTAEYAPFVHQRDDEKTKWTTRGSGGQWFEKAIKRLIPQIKQILINNTKTK